MVKTETQIISQKTPYFKLTFQISKYTTEQQKFRTMFNFQQSQITQKDFEQPTELLLKNPMAYAKLNLMLIHHYTYL